MIDKVHGAFDGDTFLYDDIARVIKDYSIDIAVETGTGNGRTSEALSHMVSKVYTVEINQMFWKITEHFDKAGSNISRFLKDSTEVFKNLDFLKPEDKVLFYLDAHGLEHSPLLDEIEGIARAGLKPVIVIHDFFNPHHPKYGYDNIWDIGPYNLKTISPALMRVYGGKYRHWYNGKADGIKHGVIFIAPN